MKVLVGSALLKQDLDDVDFDIFVLLLFVERNHFVYKFFNISLQFAELIFLINLVSYSSHLQQQVTNKELSY